MNALIRTQAVRFGTIGGGIAVAYSLIAYLAAPSLFTNTWLGIALILVYLGILIYAGIDTRKKMGGYISFREAFSTVFLSGVIMSLVNVVFSILLFGVIDTEFAAMLNEMVIEKAVEMSERFGAPPSQIETMVTQMQENPQFSVMNQAKGFVYGLIFYAVLAAVIGALIKKNKPEFEA
jgi:hypothetical protein